MDAYIVFAQMAQLVLIIGVGFTIRRIGLIDETANVYITRLLLRVTLPATLLSSLADSTLEVPLAGVFILLGIIILSYVFMAIPSFAFPYIFRAPKDERTAYAALGLFSNVNFVGVPVAHALFGPEGMFYVVLSTIIFNLSIFSLGMKLIGGKKAKISIKFFLTPIMIAAVTAVILFMLEIQLPVILNNSLSRLGGITTPAAMLLIGSILGGMKFKEIFTGWRIYAITGWRLIIIPIIVYIGLLPFDLSPTFLAVTIIMSASPMAISTATFTVHYDAHKELVSKGVFISTLLSVITIPLVLSLLL